ncbi:hypothetical protein ES705_50585 [subsurface metagenome]
MKNESKVLLVSLLMVACLMVLGTGIIIHIVSDKSLTVDFTIKESQSFNTFSGNQMQEDCTWYDGKVNGITYRNAICSPIPLKVYHKTIVIEIDGN